MIFISIKLKQGEVTGFEIKGHSGYAECGKDIVCSAISAICYTAIGYFENKYNPEEDAPKVLYRETEGHIIWCRPKAAEEKRYIEDCAVLEAMTLGFKQIEYSYGKKYITVKEEEV